MVRPGFLSLSQLQEQHQLATWNLEDHSVIQQAPVKGGEAGNGQQGAWVKAEQFVEKACGELWL